jgi:hypothetical protein
MTEPEWLGCTDLFAVLYQAHGKISPRKLRLFAVACCRRIEHLLTDLRSREALAVAERHADGLADEAHRALAADAAFAVYGDVQEAILRPWQLGSNEAFAHYMAADAARAACSAGFDRYERGTFNPRGVDAAEDAATVKGNVISSVIEPAAIATAYTAGVSAEAWRNTFYESDSSGFIYYSTYLVNDDAWPGARQAERRAQFDLLREIIGNPYHPVSGARGWMTWNNCCVLELAESIYEESAFDRLPILADALEDAGCTHTVLLEHCRQPGCHVKGCWAVDLLSGRR